MRVVCFLAGCFAAWLAVLAPVRAEESFLSAWFGSGAPLQSGRPSAFVLFSAQEADISSRHASIGFKARPFRPLGEDRFVLLAAFGHGDWREQGKLALGRESDSRKSRVQILGGTELSIGGGTLGLFAGPEYFWERAVDPVGTVLRRERRWGLRGQIDWWSHPTPETLLAVNVAAGTAKRDVWSRALFGWKLGEWPRFTWGFAGPEISFSAAPDSRKFRVGAHWSEWGFFGFRFRMSGGFSREDGRPSIYLTFGSYRAF